MIPVMASSQSAVEFSELKTTCDHSAQFEIKSQLQSLRDMLPVIIPMLLVIVVD